VSDDGFRADKIMPSKGEVTEIKVKLFDRNRNVVHVVSFLYEFYTYLGPPSLTE
jgi:hypothetical protein